MVIKYFLKAFTLYFLFINQIGGTNQDNNLFKISGRSFIQRES